MNLIIYFKKIGEMEIRLIKAGKLIDALDFSFHGNLDDLLISSVDKVLKKNRIETLSLKTVKVLGNLDPVVDFSNTRQKRVKAEGNRKIHYGVEKSSSAYKIARTFIEAIKASKKANIAGS